MRDDEREATLELVMRAFDEAVRPGYTDEGAEEFARSARSFLLESLANHVTHVAEASGQIVGMVDMRDGSHICLFFVDSSRRAQGVGRALLDAAIASACATTPGLRAITVNAAPSAVAAYQRLGFVAVESEQERHGIRYVPMSKPLEAST